MSQLQISSAYRAALLALDSGKRVRRSSWHSDFLLSKQDSRFVLSTAESIKPSDWQGPTEEDAAATDWQIV